MNYEYPGMKNAKATAWQKAPDRATHKLTQYPMSAYRVFNRYKRKNNS
jgi:hypothetical protein